MERIVYFKNKESLKKSPTPPLNHDFQQREYGIRSPHCYFFLPHSHPPKFAGLLKVLLAFVNIPCHRWSTVSAFHLVIYFLYLTTTHLSLLYWRSYMPLLTSLPTDGVRYPHSPVIFFLYLTTTHLSLLVYWRSYMPLLTSLATDGAQGIVYVKIKNPKKIPPPPPPLNITSLAGVLEAIHAFVNIPCHRWSPGNCVRGGQRHPHQADQGRGGVPLQHTHQPQDPRHQVLFSCIGVSGGGMWWFSVALMSPGGGGEGRDSR